MVWPPTLDELKADLEVLGDGDDTVLERHLAAAVAHVERVRKGEINFAGDLGSPLPDPDADLVLGTIRLAGRWFTRRRSPDGLIPAGDLGTSRVPGVDADIEQLLGVGRFRRAVFA